MVAALDTEAEQPVAQLAEVWPALGPLTRRQHDRLAGDAGRGEAVAHGVGMGQDVVVGDDRHRAAAGKRGQMLCGAGEQAVLDQYGVAAVAQFDRDARAHAVCPG
ncbi:hypothetical protein WR25_04463 [Diploscapter pachys]|uniref:Uncharacterized protein n=1 Tax=Diploscapter pachys TaxID=2018661 RepID=A0A2A2M3D2_9BILA|nr:hypothetical protein WR25_04463 [Diploscapter pachys]